MSLDGPRDVYLKEKKNEIANCEQSRKRKLRELYNYTALLNAGRPPQLDDWSISDQPDEKESRFLDENDITKSRRFTDASLPFPPALSTNNASLPPTLPLQNPAKVNQPPFSKPSASPVVGASPDEQLRAASASPAATTQTPPSVEVSPQKDNTPAIKPSAITARADSSSHVATPVAEEEVPNGFPVKIHQPERAVSSEAPAVQEQRVQAPPIPDGPSLDPKDAAPSSTGKSAELLDQQTTVEDKPKAPQVVHLPPQEAQEARLRETERKLEKAVERERKEDEKLTLPNANGPTDLVSSPSSTVGAYSQATPHAPHHSPDTSPDTESFRDHVPQPVQDTDVVDAAAQQVKDDHERALQQRMREARERAREIRSPTPDVQRQIEHEQAIRLARDGKGRLSESQPSGEAHSLTEEAENVAKQHTQDTRKTVKIKATPEPAADSLPTPTTIAPESSTLDSEAVDHAPAKHQESAPLLPEHPTPPADVDVEMEDASASAKDQHIKLEFQLAAQDPVSNRPSPSANRQKSISEIAAEPTKAVLTPRSNNASTLVTPPRFKSRDQKRKSISTVVFAKTDQNRANKALQLHNEDYASLQGASQDSSRDYLEGLFRYQAHHPPRSTPLQELVASARKTVSTAGTLAMIREHQDYKILKRVYQLQNANRWSLRQLQKSAEPERPFTHQDQLLLEMKWMQTDFKEERKWKRALAATFAGWCAEYVNSEPEVQKSLRVRARIPKVQRRISNADEDMNDAPTPDLISSGANETESESFADEDELLPPFSCSPPTGLFSLGFSDVVMKIERTPASDTMFRELPLYEPAIEGVNDVTPLAFCDPPILPVSKFVTGKLVSQVRGPPRKRSRYEYDSEDEPSSPPSRSGTSAEHSMPSTPGRRLFCRNDLPPEMTDVALFNTENKHVRDRLQAAHQFRPPSEFPMPSVSFFENRNSSQWLWDEDQKLRALVKEYTFNWSLVAQQLSLPSMFVSGSGRRTPWECFERWVQLEGLPAEMSKTQYFRTYQGRLEQAQRTVMAQHQAQQQLLQQQTQNGQGISGQQRRRTTQPIRVERRRENRHLAIIDGMRKLARKRESIAHKQAESQKAAALRKAHEPVPPKSTIHTPQEFSRLKWEREEKLKQRQLQQEMHVRQQMAAQRQAQMQAQAGMANGVNQAQRNGTPVGNPNMPTQMANNPSQQGQNAAAMAARSHQQSQQGMPNNFPNGNMSGMSMGNSNVPQAQMQANMQNQQRMPPPDQVRMVMQQRGQFPNTNQQHQFHLQQQQINMASNLTQGMGMNGIPNANMMASMASQSMNGNMNGNMNGTMNANMNGMSNNAGSPRMNQANPNMPSPARPLSSGHMPQLLQIQNTIKGQHPDWPQEQIQKVASEQLTRFLAKQRVQAMNAAAGSPNGLNPNQQIGNNHYLQNGGMANSPSPNAVQNYQQQLVQQQRLMQQQRQQAGSPGLNARPPSRSATPQNPQQLQHSPGMQQAQVNRS